MYIFLFFIISFNVINVPELISKFIKYNFNFVFWLFHFRFLSDHQCNILIESRHSQFVLLLELLSINILDDRRHDADVFCQLLRWVDEKANIAFILPEKRRQIVYPFRILLKFLVKCKDKADLLKTLYAQFIVVHVAKFLMISK